MAKLLADLKDINTHLPADKAVMEDDYDDSGLQIDAYRFVRSLLSGFVDTSVLAGWTKPANTPDVIRAIAGRLIAAKFYLLLFSEDSEGEPSLAQKLYNEATAMLREIRAGTLTILDSTGTEILLVDDFRWSRDDFYPNDDTEPKFSMDMNFA